jgi:hypothetical protein
LRIVADVAIPDERLVEGVGAPRFGTRLPPAGRKTSVARRRERGAALTVLESAADHFFPIGDRF